MELKTLSAKQRQELAKRAGLNAAHLYQIATGRRFPRPATVQKLLDAEPELCVEQLYREAMQNQRRRAA